MDSLLATTTAAFASVTKDGIVAVVSIIGAIVAIIGISTWKRELAGKTEYEFAQEVLRNVYAIEHFLLCGLTSLQRIVQASEAGDDETFNYFLEDFDNDTKAIMLANDDFEAACFKAKAACREKISSKTVVNFSVSLHDIVLQQAILFDEFYKLEEHLDYTILKERLARIERYIDNFQDEEQGAIVAAFEKVLSEHKPRRFSNKFKKEWQQDKIWN